MHLPLIPSFQPLILMQPINTWSAISPQDFDSLNAQTLAEEKNQPWQLTSGNILHNWQMG